MIWYSIFFQWVYFIFINSLILCPFWITFKAHEMSAPNYTCPFPYCTWNSSIHTSNIVITVSVDSPSIRVYHTLRWRHDGHDSVSNHQPHHCLLNRLFRRRSKKTSKLRVTGLCAGNSPETGEFPAQMASNAEKFSIWWRHHELRETSLIRL